MCCNTVFYFNKLFCSFVMSPAVVGNCVSHYFQAGFLLFSCTMGSAFTRKCFLYFSELILNFRPVSEPFFITVLQQQYSNKVKSTFTYDHYIKLPYQH